MVLKKQATPRHTASYTKRDWQTQQKWDAAETDFVDLRNSNLCFNVEQCGTISIHLSVQTVQGVQDKDVRKGQ